MKKFLLSSALVCSAAFAAAPASAVVLLPDTTVVADPFNPLTRGTQLAFQSIPGVTTNFAALLTSAVYLNTNNTLDFYFQISQTGPGSSGVSDDLARMSAANFAGFNVEAFVDLNNVIDFDGAGGFGAVTNLGEVTTVDRSDTGNTLGVNFPLGPSRVDPGETSAVYIFRTNATEFNAGGTFSAIDGNVFTVSNFQPVPEPATWLMMIAGFGLVGAAIRRRRRTTKIAFA